MSLKRRQEVLLMTSDTGGKCAYVSRSAWPVKALFLSRSAGASQARQLFRFLTQTADTNSTSVFFKTHLSNRVLELSDDQATCEARCIGIEVNWQPEIYTMHSRWCSTLDFKDLDCQLF